MRRGRLLAAVLGLAVAATMVSGPAQATGDRSALAFARQAAGQRVIYSYPGLTPPDALLQASARARRPA